MMGEWRQQFLGTECVTIKVRPAVRWACSAVGSAPEWHSGGHRFDPGQVHNPFLRSVVLDHSPGAQPLACGSQLTGRLRLGPPSRLLTSKAELANLRGHANRCLRLERCLWRRREGRARNRGELGTSPLTAGTSGRPSGSHLSLADPPQHMRQASAKYRCQPHSHRDHRQHRRAGEAVMLESRGRIDQHYAVDGECH
jgi:hypothetical protein